MPLSCRDRGSRGTQLDIWSGGVVVGKLWKTVSSVTAGQEPRWNWSWQGGPSKGPEQHGTADTIDDAKSQLERQWQEWLLAAGLQETRARTQ